ncbi:hypothetical protein [Comamonas testosteroni]|uniref:hypothetical protein n=1 Tax=Comamonas testosteroni TaxID=285 RepID=UPI0026E9FEFE|nr:hypothetical protein [Comamonas testosteroni]
MSVTSISPPRPVMHKDEYKKVRERSGITVTDIWCSAIRISKDQDKSYASGRTAIPDEVCERVRDTIVMIEKASEELHANLQDVLKECDVTLDRDTLQIAITFPSGKKAVLEQRGLEITMLRPIYKADPATRHEALFLLTDEKPWDPKVKGHRSLRWFLWRGDFVESQNAGRIQSYRNDLTERLLYEAFKRYL